MFDEATKIKQHLPDLSCDSIDIFPKMFLTKSFIQNFKHGLNLQVQLIPWCLQYFKPA